MVETDKVAEPGPLFRGLVSLAVIAYVLALLVQMSPASNVKERLEKSVTPVLEYLGIWQNFAVFSPNPRSTNIFLSATVTFADGSAEFFEYPRLERLNMWERVQKERFRKYGLDNVYNDGERGLWPDLARYIARLYYGAGKKPIAVSLQRHWSDIPPPEEGLANPLPEQAKMLTFYVYDVKPEDLQ